MQGENLGKSGILKSYTDATAKSDEYIALNQHVLTRHNAYQKLLNRACKSHTDYATSDLPNSFEQCVSEKLGQLGPLIESAEAHYDELHASKYNVKLFADVVREWGAEGKEFLRRRDNSRYRFGSGSFFDKYEAFGAR